MYLYTQWWLKCIYLFSLRYNVGCTKRMGLFPSKANLDIIKKQRASNINHQNSSADIKKQVKHPQFFFLSNSFKIVAMGNVSDRIAVFLTEPQRSSSHRSIHVVPTPLSSKSRWVESVFGHVRLRRARFTAVRCQLRNPETSERGKIRAPVSHAALPGKWPHQVERGGRLRIHLLVAR